MLRNTRLFNGRLVQFIKAYHGFILIVTAKITKVWRNTNKRKKKRFEKQILEFHTRLYNVPYVPARGQIHEAYCELRLMDFYNGSTIRQTIYGFILSTDLWIEKYSIVMTKGEIHMYKITLHMSKKYDTFFSHPFVKFTIVKVVCGELYEALNCSFWATFFTAHNTWNWQPHECER